jgi:tight adherence protein B
MVGPTVLARRRRALRAEAVAEQLGEAVAAIAAGVRAGLSLPQAIGFAADEGEPPLSHSLRDVLERTDMGLRLEESLDALARWHGGRDGRLVVSVLQLHHRTGGDLPRVLDQVRRTLADRRAAAREVRSLTAQARLSGAIVGLLPVGFFLFLSATSPEQMAAAYRSPWGLTAIAVGLVLETVAFVWIRALLRVDV